MLCLATVARCDSKGANTELERLKALNALGLPDPQYAP